MEGPVADAYREASEYLVAAVRRIPGDRWGAPGLGEWSILELVAHANRSHTLIGEYLTRPVAPAGPDSGYFDPAAVAARARAGVKALGSDPAISVEQAAAEAAALVAATPSASAVGSPLGTVSLAEYLPSRVAELTLHGDDLWRALGQAVAPPGSAVAETVAFLGSRAQQRGMGVEAMRLLSGRDPRVDFNVY